MRKSITTAAIAILGALVLAPFAQATSDPLGRGTTKLVLDKSFAAFLKRDGVTLSPTSPGRLKAGAIVLPVSGGLMDPTTGKGTIEQDGTLVFDGGAKLPLRDIVLKTNHSPLIAKVGGSQLKVATSSKLSSKRNGFGVKFSARQLRLTAKAAGRLNKKLRPPFPFEAGQTIGSVVSNAEPITTAILASNGATLALDAGLLAKLESLHVSLNPISPAQLAPGPLFTLPIVSDTAIAKSSIAPDASTGLLQTGGAIELLQLHAGQVFWQNLTLDLAAKVVLAEVDIQPAPPYPGKLGQVPILSLEIPPTSVSADPKARTITVTGARLSFQPATAAAFNQAFAAGKEAFKAGEAGGTISFTAQAQ